MIYKISFTLFILYDTICAMKFRNDDNSCVGVSDGNRILSKVIIKILFNEIASMLL